MYNTLARAAVPTVKNSISSKKGTTLHATWAQYINHWIWPSTRLYYSKGEPDDATEHGPAFVDRCFEGFRFLCGVGMKSSGLQAASMKSILAPSKQSRTMFATFRTT